MKPNILYIFVHFKMLHDLGRKKWFQPLLIVLSCILLNVNTFHHEYALDDEMVITKNILVHKGFAGIPGILSQDALKSYYSYLGVNQLNLAGGRYRPLSIVSFAVEQEIFGNTIGEQFEESKFRLQQKETSGTNATEILEEAQRLKQYNNQLEVNALDIASVRHVFQVIYFCICCLCLFWFLQLTFGHIKFLPFIATLLFAFHPVHTEVIANLKSRDEIFSLTFILLTCCYCIKYFRDIKKIRYLYLALGFYLLAFLSKEYAFGLIIILPVIYYLQSKESLFSFLNRRWFWAFAASSAVFLFIRYTITKGAMPTHTEILNEPYLYATANQKAASIISVWMEYLRILFYPVKLSSDYSYNTFKLVDFSSVRVWVSLIFWTAAAGLSIWLLIKRKIMALPLIWFLVFFVMINNMFFNIGATMGERLIFHSSVGFCILIAYFILQLPAVVSLKKGLTIASFLLLLPVLFVFGKKTIARNADWRNDYTLFTTDVKTVPNSSMVNCNAGTQIFNRGHELIGRKTTLTNNDQKIFFPYVKKSLKFFDKAISIHPNLINARLNRALCYMFLDQLDSAMIDWLAVKKLYPNRQPNLVQQASTLLSKGMDYGSKKDYNNAIRFIKPASLLDPENVAIWDNLGGAYYMSGNMLEAKNAFAKALEINPSLQDARNGFNAADYNLKVNLHGSK